VVLQQSKLEVSYDSHFRFWTQWQQDTTRRGVWPQSLHSISAQPFSHQLTSQHTCRAINADGNRCPNLTPLNAAVCTHGCESWSRHFLATAHAITDHADNKRHHYVERARAVREVYSKIEEDHREIEHIQLIEYFSSCFPGVATQSSPTASSSSLDSSPTTSTMSPLSGNSSLHLQQEKWEKANRPQPLYEIPPCQSLSRPPRQATGSSPHSVSIKGA